MFDLSLAKIVVIGLLAMLLVGPDRLPRYAAQLAKWIRVLRGMADDAKSRVAAEMGPEFEDVDWQRLDPRRYHPRRLLQDAWNSADDAREPAQAAEPDPMRDEVAAHPVAADAAAEPADGPTEPGILELFAAHEAEQRALRNATAPETGAAAA